MRYQLFIFAWPGHAESARALEQQFLDRRQEVTVVASGVSDGPSHWVHLSNEIYFGGQFSKALDLFSGDVLVHIQADAQLLDIDNFLKRLRFGHEQFHPGIWAPDVNYTFYETSLVRDQNPMSGLGRDELDPSVVDVLNTDCTCWSLNSVVAKELRNFARPEWRLGWGWDTLAAVTSWSLGYRVLRDTTIEIRHPRGTGYSAQEASREFEQVKSSLAEATQKLISLQEQVILERYQHSYQWFKDRLRSRL